MTNAEEVKRADRALSIVFRSSVGQVLDTPLWLQVPGCEGVITRITSLELYPGEMRAEISTRRILGRTVSHVIFDQVDARIFFEDSPSVVCQEYQLMAKGWRDHYLR